MDRKQRVLKSDLTDVSTLVSDYLAGTTLLDSAVIYIGAELPFNHKYFELSVANAAAKTISKIELWNGSAWVEVVDINDGTKSSGISLAQSGSISWARDLRLSGWSQQYDSNDIAALATTRIFNLYWSRFTWTNADGAGACKHIGERFNTDEDLFAHYADLRSSGMMAAYETGKTDWKDQSFAAADAIVKHLRRNGTIIRREQILDTSLYNEAAVHKTAQIIYQGIGNSSENSKVAEQRFRTAIDIKFVEVDRDGSGDLSTREKTVSVNFGTR